MTRTKLDWSQATVLTAATFEACWELLHLGETPWQLEPPRQGSTAAARQTFVADAQARLLSAGADLAQKLRLLARPAWTVDVRLRADGLVAGLAACRGTDGVFAVRYGDEIALMEIPAADATAAVLSLLGPVRPGPAPPVLITTGRHPPVSPGPRRFALPRPIASSPCPAALLTHSAIGPQAFAPQVLSPTEPHPDVSPVPCPAGPDADRTVAVGQDVRMFAQLGVSVAARDGHRMRRAPRVIGFHRTGAGDYRSVRVDPFTVAVGPATLARLTTDLDDLLAVDPYSGLAGRGSM
jgi:hypothetical protein